MLESITCLPFSRQKQTSEHAREGLFTNEFRDFTAHDTCPEINTHRKEKTLPEKIGFGTFSSLYL